MSNKINKYSGPQFNDAPKSEALNEDSEDLFFHKNNDFKELDSGNWAAKILIPLLFVVYFSLILYMNSTYIVVAKEGNSSNGFLEVSEGIAVKGQSKYNILSEDDLSKGLKDTVYTTLNCWLELRIDRQMLYQHWRDGKTQSYPISSGNKYLERSTESKPGLFAIFYKNEHHESSQYNNADMYHFMPFNQGNGFHSLNGTGYYGALGKVPSSHGCIRMKHEDVKKIFRDCPLGTLVLAHSGTTSRVVGFAPSDFQNNSDYTKQEFKKFLALNLLNILEGKYYLADRKYFVIDPLIVPKSGIYIGHDKKIPEKQQLPKLKYIISNLSDKFPFELKVTENFKENIVSNISESDSLFLSTNQSDDVNNEMYNGLAAEDLVKKYFNNPIGILPYYGPVK